MSFFPTVGERIYSYISQQTNTIKNQSIIDIGCGIGFYTRAFCRNENNIYGLDLQCVYNFGDDGHSRLGPTSKFLFQFIQGDGTQLPFSDNSFDLVVSFDVIEHVEDYVLFLENSFRVLKPKGLFILGTPNLNRFTNKIRRVKFPKSLGYDPQLGEIYHLREFSISELKICTKQSGFSIQRTVLLGSGVHPQLGHNILPPQYRHYILVFATK